MRITPLALLVSFLVSSMPAHAATVDFVHHRCGDNYVDMFYTVTPGGEFTNWDLVVTPHTGSILDPNPLQRTFNVNSGAPVPIDTFVNTVFSSVGAGPASYVFTEYHPGSPFPPTPPQPNPTVGATPPNPDQLNWTIFDTATGDGNVPGAFPYHMARIVFSPREYFTISASFFDTTNTGVGERFNFTIPLMEDYYDCIPEPSTALLFAVSACGLSAAMLTRRKSDTRDR